MHLHPSSVFEEVINTYIFRNDHICHYQLSLDSCVFQIEHRAVGFKYRRGFRVKDEAEYRPVFVFQDFDYVPEPVVCDFFSLSYFSC
ncbi:hypothetical protein BMS3Abin08_00366 [bacterium BMS3Abin08]|nr:hypothetical protein BMS3Abin08_00366 [bacterium BMS3Abin08]